MLGVSDGPMIPGMAERKDLVISFESLQLKKRLLEIKEEHDISIAKILRVFTERGLAAYEEEGAAMFYRPATKREKKD